jgi:hypothetical protein
MVMSDDRDSFEDSSSTEGVPIAPFSLTVFPDAAPEATDLVQAIVAPGDRAENFAIKTP